MTALKLAGELYCGPRRARAAAVDEAEAEEAPHLGPGQGGRFQTHGQSSVATVRGTRWLTEDTCTGTPRARRRGRGLGQADRAPRAVLVRAGHSLFTRRQR